MPRYGSRTDVGNVRDHNEDNLLCTPFLFVVADGMGGHAAGEVASEIAIQTIERHLSQIVDSDSLARAVVAANRAIISAARAGRGRAGMGTTMTAAFLRDTRVSIAQVGDSRAYLLHNNTLQRITRDHSIVADLIAAGEITEEEALTHPQRSVITRALGSDPKTLPDIYEMNTQPGDRMLLCSDGLSGMISDRQIADIMKRVKDPQRCTDALISAACDAGGYDNVTAVVIDVVGNSALYEARERRASRLKGAVAALLVVAVIVAAGFGSHAYLNHIAFVTVQNDEVVICRGLPGSILGIQTWTFDQGTGLSVADLDLPANTIQRLQDEGIRTDSVDDALDLVQTWQDQSSARASSDAAEGKAGGSE